MSRFTQRGRWASALVLALAAGAVCAPSAAAMPFLETQATNNSTLRTTWQGNIAGAFPANRLVQLENFNTGANANTLVVFGRSTGGAALSSFNNSTGFGVAGRSTNGAGIVGTTAGGTALSGTATNGMGTTQGVFARVLSPDGFAGFFENETPGASTSGVGLAALGRGHNAVDLGLGGDGFDGGIEAAGPNGIEGNSTTPGGYGVSGDGPAIGVAGTATDPSGTGVNAVGGTAGTGVIANGGTNGVSASGGTTGVTASGGSFGLDANVSGGGAVGVRSTTGSSSGDAVQANTSGTVADGVQATVSGPSAFGLFANVSNGATGVVSQSGPGTALAASNSDGTLATLQSTNGALNGSAGRFTGDNALIVRPTGTFGRGITADMSGDVNGDANAANDGNEALFASSDDTNSAAVITSNTPSSCDALTCEAIETSGFVDINGNARVTGTLTKGGGAFEIDHPLDPENYYLRHSFVESPDMKNIYDGIVTTDSEGNAEIELPGYFGALNRDFRYQLTTIGTFARAMVSEEIEPGGRTFEIRTEDPDVKVSWQVTGIRKDAYANANRIKVVERKTGAASEKFLHPELFGRPAATPLGLDLPRPSRERMRASQRAAAALLALIEKKSAEAKREAAAHRGVARFVPIPKQASRDPRPAPRRIHFPDPKEMRTR